MAEKQKSFNEAVDRVTKEKDDEIAKLKARLEGRETTDTASQTTDTNLASGKIVSFGSHIWAVSILFIFNCSNFYTMVQNNQQS